MLHPGRDDAWSTLGTAEGAGRLHELDPRRLPRLGEHTAELRAWLRDRTSPAAASAASPDRSQE